MLQSMGTAARSVRVELQHFSIRSWTELDNAFDRIEQEGISAVALNDDSLLINNMSTIMAMATRAAEKIAEKLG